MIGETVLAVEHWSAWGGGLASAADWQAWLAGRRVPDHALRPANAFLPALQRRRLSRLSRMALEVAHECLLGRADDPGTALVFCTRHGEIARTFELLRSLAAPEALSPAAFSTSVYNTAVGFCSIAEGFTGHATVVSAGPSTLEHGFVESHAMLATGEAAAVVLVFHEEPLPAAYGDLPMVIGGGIALGLRLRRAEGGAAARLPMLALRHRAGGIAPGAQASADARAIALIRLLLQAADDPGAAEGAVEWHWQRRDHRHGAA